MASGRRKVRRRREPAFDVVTGSGGDLRADPRDRAGGSADDMRPRARRTSAKGGRSKIAGWFEGKPEKGGGGKQRGKGGGGGGRSWFRRLFYWSFVLGLWGVIAVIGAIAWIGAHLPAIQSLEVPKRPPS